MRFGGHETFFVREGWLSKGLSLVINNPEWLPEYLSSRLSLASAGTWQNQSSIGWSPRDFA